VYRHQAPAMTPEARVNAAVEDIRDGLLERGVVPDAAHALAEQARERILVAGAGDHVEFRYPGNAMGVYPSTVDPLRHVVTDIYRGASAVDRGETTAAERDEQQIAAQRERFEREEALRQSQYAL
jgi:hypothetical protein